MERINNLTKEEAIDLVFKIGFEAEAKRYNCAQAVFHAVSSVLGIRNQLILKCLSAFEAGGADTTYGSCGAFNGALVVFGYYFGRSYEQWEEGKYSIKASTLGQKLYKKFDEKYETITCREIHKKIFGMTFELMDKGNLGLNKNELAEFNKMGAHESKCPTVVGLSAKVGSGEAIPFEDNLFDAVLSMTSLEFSNNPDEFVSEMARVAKPSSIVVVAVLNLFSFYGISRRIDNLSNKT